MADSYPGHATIALVANDDSAFDLAGLVAGITLNNAPGLEAGYYIGSDVQRHLYVGYTVEMGFDALRKGAASEAMAGWVEAADNPDAWVAVAAANGRVVATANRAYFGERRFASHDFTVDFTTIIGANVAMEQRGTVYRGTAHEVDLTAAGTLAPTFDIPDAAGSGNRALLIVTEVSQTAAPTLAIGGQTINDIDAPGAYFTTADLTAGALSAVFGGTFTSLKGWLLVGRGMV